MIIFFLGKELNMKMAKKIRFRNFVKDVNGGQVPQKGGGMAVPFEEEFKSLQQFSDHFKILEDSVNSITIVCILKLFSNKHRLKLKLIINIMNALNQLYKKLMNTLGCWKQQRTMHLKS